MNVPSIVRSKLVRGVSLFALCALVGIGYSTNKEPLPDLSSMSYFELEGLAEPLFEEIFRDKHGRALEAYKSSKGLFSCDETCQENKRQLEEAEIELTATLRERLAARQAILAQARADRLALHQSRQAEAAERRAMTSFSGEERISARSLARQAEREADRAATIAAYRLSLGVSEHPLTLEEKQARAAENLRKRQEARGAIKTPAERAQEADDRQAARWFEYLNEVAQAHGFPSWHFAEQFFDMPFEERMAVREGNQNKGKIEARSDVRSAMRGATQRTPAIVVTTHVPEDYVGDGTDLGGYFDYVNNHHVLMNFGKFGNHIAKHCRDGVEVYVGSIQFWSKKGRNHPFYIDGERNVNAGDWLDGDYIIQPGRSCSDRTISYASPTTSPTTSPTPAPTKVVALTGFKVSSGVGAGKCAFADSHGGLYLQACSDSENQKFVFDEAGHITLLGGTHPNKCLLADNFFWPKMRECSSNDDQMWTFEDSRLKVGLKCLVFDPTWNETRLKVDSCSNDEYAMIWEPRPGN